MPVADPRIFRRRPPGNGALEWLFRHFPDRDLPGPISPPAANRPFFQTLGRLWGVMPPTYWEPGKTAFLVSHAGRAHPSFPGKRLEEKRLTTSQYMQATGGFGVFPNVERPKRRPG